MNKETMTEDFPKKKKPIKKYIFYGFVFLSICEFFILWQYDAVNETLYKIASKTDVFFISIWSLILARKMVVFVGKTNKKWYEYIISVIFFILIPVFLMIAFGGILFSFVGSYADGSYDRCMAECVLPDESNYSECSLSVCDFPI